MSVEGTVGGSETGPTVDAEGVPLKGQVRDLMSRDPEGNPAIVERGDIVRVVHMDDPTLQRYVGHVGECEWVQDHFPFSQVILVGFDDPNLEPLSTYSAWVRKAS